MNWSWASRPSIKVPKTPHMRWTEMAPTGSSTLIRSKKRTERTTKTPAPRPMMSESATLTNAHGAVMATRPAREPLRIMVRSGFLSSSQASYRVDDGGAGEVKHPQLRQPSSPPDPVADDRVDDPDHEKREQVEGTELDPLCHRTRHDGGGGPGKDELEEELGPQGRPRPIEGAVQPLIGVPGGRAVIGAGQEEQPLRPEEGGAVAKHEPEAQDQEGQGSGAKNDEVLGQDRHGVLGPTEPGLHHREAQVHEEN